MRKNVAPLSPPCPTCGKEMRLTGHAPTCEGVIYDFLCSDDGDLLSWRPGHQERAASGGGSRPSRDPPWQNTGYS
jgi:hypothetical protein